MNDPEKTGGRLAARLAARAAHDLNNIAAVFAGHIYLLRSNAEPLEEALDSMDKGMAHLERLTRSLSSMGTIGVDPLESFDVNEALAVAAKAMGSVVQLDLGPNLPAWLGRKSDLSRAVEALLTNSLEASESARPVRLVTRYDSQDGITIRVEDEGSGIPVDVKRRDFDPLFSTKGQKGRGIGVTFAMVVAALEGGSLVIGDRERGGTEAVLRLPAG